MSEELFYKSISELDSMMDSGNLSAPELLSALDGIPVGLKDVIAVRGQKLTCASKMLENYVSPYTGTAAQKLLDSGAVFWGRLNMDEFAMGSSCENSAFKKTRNPWDLSRIPGGSSGGSAAAVASGECVAALGSDTGGSIRQPASLCGIVGMKPTYGTVSRYGLVAYASSLDQMGPIARSAAEIRTINYRQYENPRLAQLADSIAAETAALKE